MVKRNEKQKRAVDKMSIVKTKEILRIVRELNADEFRHPLTNGNTLDDVLEELTFYLQKHRQNKGRIAKIIEVVTKLSSGDFSSTIAISEQEDELDVICMSLNVLAEELSTSAISIQAFDEVFNSFNTPYFIINTANNSLSKFNPSTLTFFNYTAPNKYNIPIGKILNKGVIKLYNSLNFKGDSITTIQHPYENEKGKWVVNFSRLSSRFYQAPSIAVFISDVTSELNKQQEVKNLIIRTIVDTEEKERVRFAKDLHDSLGQQLSAIKFYLGAFMNTSKGFKDNQMLRKSNDTLTSALSELRNICFNLVPQALDAFGLMEAINELCRKNKLFELLRFKITASSNFPTLNKSLEVAIFRIVQEFISNSTKHANATKIDIIFKDQPGAIQIKLKDNGKGFNINKGSLQNGMGLKNVHSRVQSYNGEIKINSKLGKGTEYSIFIPLNSTTIGNNKKPELWRKQNLKNLKGKLQDKN